MRNSVSVLLHRPPGREAVIDGVRAIVLTAGIPGLLFVFVEYPSMEYRKSPTFRRLAADPASAPRQVLPTD